MSLEHKRRLPEDQFGAIMEKLDRILTAVERLMPANPEQAAAPVVTAKYSVLELVRNWNSEVAEPFKLPKIEILSETRKKKAALRVHEHPDPNFWGFVFGEIEASPFLRGMTENGNGHQKWRATFDWLVENDTNCVKVYEGRYRNG